MSHNDAIKKSNTLYKEYTNVVHWITNLQATWLIIIYNWHFYSVW